VYPPHARRSKVSVSAGEVAGINTIDGRGSSTPHGQYYRGQ